MVGKTFYQKFILQIALMLPDKFHSTFLHPAGPTTIFFWAPMFKWGLVIAGIADITRAPQMISLNQTASLVITGAIWSRYSIVIVPKNYSLLSVNLFICGTGMYNFLRGLIYDLNRKYDK